METILSYSTEILILLFILITFAQSGIDKLQDWKGQISWLKDHFKGSVLGGFVPLLLGTLTALEIAVSVLTIMGAYQLLIDGESTLALYATILAAITLLCMLYGQRVAKDYAGAFTIVGYFIVVIFGVFLLSS